MPAREAPVAIRPLQSIDLPFVVEQHQQHFPHGFFARLGSRFLARYYLTYCTSDDALAVVATAAGVRVGYLVGTTSPAAHRHHVLTWHRSALATLGLLGLLRHPTLVLPFARTRALLYARKLAGRPQRRQPATAGTPDEAVLSHLVVLPRYQGRGVGSRLVAEFETAAARAGRTSIVLVTETGGQGAAYYESTGWTAVKEHRTREGLHLTTYSRAVPATPLPAHPKEILP